MPSGTLDFARCLALRVNTTPPWRAQGSRGSTGVLWGPSGVLWGPYGGRLGCSGAPTGVDWGVLGALWGPTGALWGPAGGRLGVLLGPWGRPGGSLESFRRIRIIRTCMSILSGMAPGCLGDPWGGLWGVPVGSFEGLGIPRGPWSHAGQSGQFGHACPICPEWLRGALGVPGTVSGGVRGSNFVDLWLQSTPVDPHRGPRAPQSTPIGAPEHPSRPP